MKVCIYGAGAIGGYLGAELSRADGVEVSLIARGAHLAAMRENGLKLLIDGEERVARLPCTDDPAELGPQDHVIVALKTHQAWEAAEQMTPLLGPETAVVTCQNGVPWWYFHGLQGQYKDLRLASVDRTTGSGTRSGPSARSAASSIRRPRSSNPASSSTPTATSSRWASRTAARPSAASA
jgi:2-dehydropantoate 2-reductase